MELKGNAASSFIAHNINIGKWWNDPQIRKEDWKTTGRKLTNYILSNQQNAWNQIEKMKSKDPARAMNAIKRVLMQMSQDTRDKHSENEHLITAYRGHLSIEALKLEAPIGNMKTIREIMNSIESAYVKSNEYLILKAEILIRTKEWKEATMSLNGIGKHEEIMKEEWMDRISTAQGIRREVAASRILFLASCRFNGSDSLRCRVPQIFGNACQVECRVPIPPGALLTWYFL
jgi:hypothetical protein